MKPLEQTTLESLKGKTFLISKKVKNKKLELKEYVSPKDRKDGLALFTFPRELEGKPSLDAADEEVQFVAEPAGVADQNHLQTVQDDDRRKAGYLKLGAYRVGN